MGHLRRSSTEAACYANKTASRTTVLMTRRAIVRMNASVGKSSGMRLARMCNNLSSCRIVHRQWVCGFGCKALFVGIVHLKVWASELRHRRRLYQALVSCLLCAADAERGGRHSSAQTVRVVTRASQGSVFSSVLAVGYYVACSIL